MTRDREKEIATKRLAERHTDREEEEELQRDDEEGTKANTKVQAYCCNDASREEKRRTEDWEAKERGA